MPDMPDIATHEPSSTVRHKPRKSFILLGSVLAIALAIGLFTSFGIKSKSVIPQVGGQVPTFSLPRINGTGTGTTGSGSETVGIPEDGGANSKPVILLFFGNWCTICHSELPPLAAAIHKQQKSKSPFSNLNVIGIDSLDLPTVARSFIASSGVTFPVGLDSQAGVTNGIFYFTGDPYAVFVRGDGTIMAIERGPMSPSKFISLEHQLLADH